MKKNQLITAIKAIGALLPLVVMGCSVGGPDYIDEYGINHGKGIEIDGVVWAPVNCGYHATDYPWGKLYQWGRKYGQGYSGDLYDVNGEKVGKNTDAIIPILVKGPVSLKEGNSANNSNVYYWYSYDWLSSDDKTLWNSGTEDAPIKTEYDPCPDGWRIPTYNELHSLQQNSSDWETNELNQSGYWFSGSSSYSKIVSRVFFPAAGHRVISGGDDRYFPRGSTGYYWSSLPYDDIAYSLCFGSDDAFMSDHGRADGQSIRCVKDDQELLSVENIALSTDSLILSVGTSDTLAVTIAPSTANHQFAYWWSSDPKVATVDANGNVVAMSEGTAIITAMAGMKTATCEVMVTALQDRDYVDEYGINHGKGIEIDGVVWAPVNCGYHATDYPWGKLYQWGRKYGQGYLGDLFAADRHKVGKISDEDIPLLEGYSTPVSLEEGNSKYNSNIYYYGEDDWLSPNDNALWNSSTKDSPVKTEYDPCPEGWRVPTYNELRLLSQNYSDWTTNALNQSGRWFSGRIKYAETISRVFFPAAGYRDHIFGDAKGRGAYGQYWSSEPFFPYEGDPFFYLYAGGRELYLDHDVVLMAHGERAQGQSVRCVLDLIIAVADVKLNLTSLTLYEGEVAQLTATVVPADATDKTVTWSSEDSRIATVDQTGYVTAISQGITTIYIVSGGVSVSCTVKVIPKITTIDYVDEYGINHGKGVQIDDVVWAPVNCGYHETDYPWGKLYQWGRKYGQGYSGDLDNIYGDNVGKFSDATTPALVEATVSLEVGNSKDNSNVFYLSKYSWLARRNNSLWNAATELSPIKTEYDPCPEGWRVATSSELKSLKQNCSYMTTNELNQSGCWFSGSNSCSEQLPRVFFPAAGCRRWCNDAWVRGYKGFYWSSLPTTHLDYVSAPSLQFNMDYFHDTVAVINYESIRAEGYSVRCVQE